MAKELTSVVLRWTDDKGTGTSTYNAASLGPTVARQRASSRAAIIHENGGEYTATEYYKDGSHFEFKNL